MSVASKNIPVALVTGILGLGLGIGGGIVLANFIEKEQKADADPDPDGNLKSMKGPPGMGPMPGGKGMPGGGKGAPKGDGAGGGRGGPGPKAQLTTLVTKLDVLTRKPLAVDLTPEQKKQVQEQLAGIDANDALSDDDAKAKLDAILKLVEGHKATLEAAGFRWPTAGAGGMPPQTPPNPLKVGEGNEHLKSLRSTLGK